jgi:multiple sugar transport system substrate-binding protein
MKNRVASIIAVGITTGLLVSGCASTANDSGKDNAAGQALSVLWPIDNRYPEEQRAWFGEISDKFSEESGASLRFETYSSANDELTRIQTAVVAGHGPDVYSIGTTFTPTASTTGAFTILGEKEWELVGGRDRFLPATLGMSGPSKDLEVGVPLSSRPFVAAYNTRLLKEAGIQEPAQTWDELAEHAKLLTKDGVYGLAVAYADSYDPWKFIWSQAVQSGNPILDLKTGKARIDDPAVAAAYERYFSWFEDGFVNPQAIGWTAPQSLASFADGEAAYMLMTSTFSSVTLDKSPIKDEYAYSLMPTSESGETKAPGVAVTSMLSGDNLGVADYSKQKDLAFAFVEFMTRDEQQMTYFERFGQLPSGVAGAKKVEAAHPELAPLIESAARSLGTPFTGAWGETQLALTDVVVQSIPALSKGEVSAKDLAERLTGAQNKAQTALNSAQR